MRHDKMPEVASSLARFEAAKQGTDANELRRAHGELEIARAPITASGRRRSAVSSFETPLEARMRR